MTNILEVYRKYSIPTNLQLHMLRAAAIGKLITDHWNYQHGPAIDVSVIIKTLLLHDMGNIVKIDLDAPLGLTDAEKEHIDDLDRKSTRLNSSHTVISYAVFCLKKKS